MMIPHAATVGTDSVSMGNSVIYTTPVCGERKCSVLKKTSM